MKDPIAARVGRNRPPGRIPPNVFGSPASCGALRYANAPYAGSTNSSVCWGTRPSQTVNIKFDWDEKKAATNVQKHGVTFDEAATVFYDPLAVIFNDEIHSEGERREIIIGHDAQNCLLLVCFTERAEVIRIISARPATKRERKDYEEHARF